MNTNENFVITISRELGSGGRTVGRKLAAALNVRYSDKELVEQLVQQFNLTTGGIEQLKGKKKNWISDFITFVAPVPKISMLVDTDSRYVQEFRPDLTTDDVYKAEAEILKGIADEGSCVIAGRSGFFVFKDHPNRLNVFITAPDASRVRRVMEKQGLPEESATALIRDIDAARENYIRRFTGADRYDSRNYDLVINAAGHTEEQVADLILSYLRQA